MTTSEELSLKIRRSINDEFVRMEYDFDDTHKHRDIIISKLVNAAEKIELIDSDGNLKGDSEDTLKVFTVALKALSDKESANTKAIALKLKNQEQEIASATAAKERIAIVLKAAAPGALPESFPTEELEALLSSSFSGEIQEFELRSNPKDLSD